MESLAPIYIIMGVSGSGKTTIGKLLSAKTGIPFFDGDDFHSVANKDKMGAGMPLTDEDRREWLGALNQLALSQTEGVIIACSALKEKYRNILTEGLHSSIHWIVLKGDFDLIHNRMMARKDHYMPPGLLQSQFEAMEYPSYGLTFDIGLSPEHIVEKILHAKNKSEFGLMGLGVMGKSLARNLASKGIRLSLYNQHVSGKEEKVAEKSIATFPEFSQAKGFEHIGEFVASLDLPRKIFLMVPAGEPVDQMIQQLLPHLQPGDIIMDGGNSHFEDTGRRNTELQKHQIHYLGIGVSGGEQGALKGPSIMPGGPVFAYDVVKEFLESIAAKDQQGQACCTYIGPGGSGHFVKMIHNGIEYAEMQLLAEIYWIFRRGMNYSPDQIADVFESWSHREASGYLLEITIKILRYKSVGELVLDQIVDIGGSKGTGSWSITAAAQLGSPANMISEALFARFVSSFKTERIEAEKQLESYHYAIQLNEPQTQHAYMLARWINHHQGFEILKAASQQYQWNLNLSDIARIWTNGCIIRSALIESLSISLVNEQNILFSRLNLVNTQLSSLVQVTTEALKGRLAVPCLSAALNYVLNYTAGVSPTNLIQAQRDFFGAHTYRNKDDPFGKSYHTDWEK